MKLKMVKCLCVRFTKDLEDENGGRKNDAKVEW